MSSKQLTRTELVGEIGKRTSHAVSVKLRVQYASWAGVSVDSFWTDAAARALFRAHLATVVGRNNSFTGVPYASDPTILAWVRVHTILRKNSPMLVSVFDSVVSVEQLNVQLASLRQDWSR